MTNDMKPCLVTGGEPMTEGQHFWEVEFVQTDTPALAPQMAGVYLGAVRPGVGHDQAPGFGESDDAFFIHLNDGSLCGSGKSSSIGNDEPQREINWDDPEDHLNGLFVQGDRVGFHLDFDSGWLHFFRNGAICGPGFSGITGPLVRSAVLIHACDALNLLPGDDAEAITHIAAPASQEEPIQPSSPLV